ncbi:MAG: transposase [Flavobacteriales bacterium Tduv]
MKGQPAYTGISLFKMMLLSCWYDVSDVETEELVKETLSYIHFCGFRLEDQTQIIRFYADFAIK